MRKEEYMFMGYLLGIDVGSTNYKAVACDYNGHFLATAKRPADTTYLEHGWAQLDPQKMWEGVAACIKEVSQALPGQICDGIGIATNGEDMFLDANGKAVHPTIRWFDTRTDKIAKAWKNFGVEQVYKITGINPNPVAGITRIQWIKKHHPELFAKIRCWIQTQGFVSLKLTGIARTSWNNACRTMAFDLRTRNWSKEILEEAGIPEDILAEPIRPGELVGTTTEDVADMIGLPAGTPVYAGGIDYACGTFATGIIKSGQMLDSTGTSEQLVFISDEPQSSPKYINKNFTSVSYVVNDKYYMMGQIISSGGILEWFKREFKGASFDELVAEASKRPIGANGCMMLPYFSGRYTLGSDAAARGAFLGITTATTRGDFVRAILEGLCFEMYSIVRNVQRISDKEIQSIYAIGGAAKSDFWMQLKADITGIRVKSKSVPEAAALGAAMLAGIGAGVYNSAEDAVKKVVFPEKVYEPNKKRHKKYMDIYERLNQQMYPALKYFNDTVTEMQSSLIEWDDEE
jgi:xylulokinase